MKEKQSIILWDGADFFMQKFMICILIALLFPYLGTLLGSNASEKPQISLERSGRRVILERENGRTAMDLEEYLIGVTAVQIPAEYGLEAVKAQAIIARTCLYRLMGEEEEIEEAALDVDYFEPGQLKSLWGQESYLDAYRLVRQAVRDTSGLVIHWQGSCIEPLFHRISAGETRQGDERHPYLSPVSATEDLEGSDYLSITVLSREEMASRLNSMAASPKLEAEQVLESLQVVSRDPAGYVETIQAGARTYGGEEIQYALGLASPAYSFEAFEGKVRCVVKGIGHGFGFDQYGASKKAAAGWNAEQILNYYYKNIVVELE